MTTSTRDGLPEAIGGWAAAVLVACMAGQAAAARVDGAPRRAEAIARTPFVLLMTVWGFGGMIAASHALARGDRLPGAPEGSHGLEALIFGYFVGDLLQMLVHRARIPLRPDLLAHHVILGGMLALFLATHPELPGAVFGAGAIEIMGVVPGVRALLPREIAKGPLCEAVVQVIFIVIMVVIRPVLLLLLAACAYREGRLGWITTVGLLSVAAFDAYWMPGVLARLGAARDQLRGKR